MSSGKLRCTCLLLLLLFLLLLSGLCWFAPLVLRSVLPSVNVTEWSAVLPDAPPLTSISSLLLSHRGAAEGAVEEEEEEQLYEEVLHSEAADTGSREQVLTHLHHSQLRFFSKVLTWR